MNRSPLATGRIPLAAFSFTLFLSAACMFAVQPMAGKMLLPLVGGTPAGWAVAMAFFQVMLLAGYLVAHLLSSLSPRGHGLAYLALLAAGLPFLPFDIASHADIIHDSPGPLDIFRLLTVTLAVPFIALSATSSTVQRLFMSAGHKSSDDPYFLYAASNLGSFIGLLSYPILIEPSLTLSAQTRDWHWGYLLLGAAAIACLLLSGNKREVKPKAEAPVSWRRRAEWLVLAFFPSSLLLGVTTYITTDVISIPLIWVIPLALYLLAFVVAFSKRRFVSMETLNGLTPACILAGVLAMTLKQLAGGYAPVMAIIHIGCFVIFALYCNMRLAALRPVGAKLTEFYLFLSIGGALGGVFNAFIAPVVFVRTIEYPVGLLALSLLLPGNGPKTRSGQILIVLLAAILLLSHGPSLLVPPLVKVLGIALCAALVGAALIVPRSQGELLFAGLACFVLVTTCLTTRQTTTYMNRNFFGVLRVYDTPGPKEVGTLRYFMHGTTNHGFQLIDTPEKRRTLPAYYTQKGPLGGLFKTYAPKRVAVIGLGAGGINCYAAPDRRFTFIDIDPDVMDIANNQFTFLKDCKSAAPPRLIVGDGRLELAKLKDEKFDMILIDAFSSDSIPVHLLTGEALRMYFDRLTPTGVLAVHISNRHFRLHTPIAMTADTLGLQSRYRYAADLDDLEPYATRSMWAVVARKDAHLNALTKKYGWLDIPRRAGMKPWTDDYTNVLSTIYFSQAK